MTSSDQRATILAVIAEERASVAQLRGLIRQKAQRAQKVRWRALKKKHAGYVKKWEEALKHEHS